MEKKIRLCYRKVIDANTDRIWEKSVFDDTYTEFKMQSQLYNPENKYHTFSDIICNAPTAEKLHFLVSTASINYIRQLNDIIPDIQNNMGLVFLPFHNFRFEILQSDISDKTKHVIAINFYSDLLTWHDTIGNQLLLSTGKTENRELLTEILSLQPFLSIYSIQQTA